MTVQAAIEDKLSGAFHPLHIEVINESNQHSVPPGSESHFKVVLVSPSFDGKRKVVCHQMVYKILAEEMADTVHALALHTYTQDEWTEHKSQTPNSPPCTGGSKKDQ